MMTTGAATPQGGRDARWVRLHEFLREDPRESVELSGDELDTLVDEGLPLAARRAPGSWWTNNPRRHYARAWLDAGRVADWSAVRDDGGTVTFARGDRLVPDLEQLALANRLRRRYFLKLAAGQARGSAPLDVHERDGWSGPHTLYLIHFPADGLFKVGVGKGDGARRIRDVMRGRNAVLVQTVRADNRYLVNVAECDVLDTVRPWYRYGNPRHPAGGATEAWDDGGPHVDLSRFLLDVVEFVGEVAHLPLEAWRVAVAERADAGNLAWPDTPDGSK